MGFEEQWNVNRLGVVSRNPRKFRRPSRRSTSKLLEALGQASEHINLTGDYLWRSSAKIGAGKFRPLRPMQTA